MDECRNSWWSSSSPRPCRGRFRPYPWGLDNARKILHLHRASLRIRVPCVEESAIWRVGAGSKNFTFWRSPTSSGIQINVALAELIADSESELAFVIGHEMGHVFQARTGRRTFSLNSEKDADSWGMLLSLFSGYDPYAGAGALAKLAMISGSAGLTSEFILQILDASGHGSFNERLDSIYNSIQFVCNLSSEVALACAEYHDTFHPHVPGVLLTNEP